MARTTFSISKYNQSNSEHKDWVSLPLLRPNDKTGFLSLGYNTKVNRLFMDFYSKETGCKVETFYDLNRNGKLELQYFEVEKSGDFAKRLTLLDKRNDSDDFDFSGLDGNYEAAKAITNFYGSNLFNVAVQFINAGRINGRKVKLDLQASDVLAAAQDEVENIESAGFTETTHRNTYNDSSYLKFLPLAGYPQLKIDMGNSKSSRRLESDARLTAYYTEKAEGKGNTEFYLAAAEINKTTKLASLPQEIISHNMQLSGTFGRIDLDVEDGITIYDISKLEAAEKLLSDPRLTDYLEKNVFNSINAEGEKPLIDRYKEKVAEIRALPKEEAEKKYHQWRNHNPAALTIPQEEQDRIRSLSPEQLFAENRDVFEKSGQIEHFWDFFDDKYGEARFMPSRLDGSENETALQIMANKMHDENSAWVGMNEKGWAPVMVKSGMAMTKKAENGEDNLYTVSPECFLHLKRYVGFHSKPVQV